MKPMNCSPSTTSLDNSFDNYYAIEEFNSLIQDHLSKKQDIFDSINQLVNKLHKAQTLLEQDRGKEALILVEQLVSDGEYLTRQL